MLIYSFVMYEITVQEISLPKFGGTGGPSKSKVLNLAVLVAKDQFLIKIQGGKEPQEIAIKKKKVRKCTADEQCGECSGEEYEDYDYGRLYNEVAKLKESKGFAEVDSINIGADDSVPWKVLALTIDAVRVKLEKNTYDDTCSYRRGKVLKIKTTDADGNEVTKAAAMFPKIVFVML